ncbi:hypothetical protein ACMGGR_05380 [Erwinia sp. BNK-24-b]|uniref:hypothetical protein n=1 Tax=Erwinia TaxID=551 RepID=UPI001FF076AC|nr:hypothetical protein [Erwinia phyllosphaerae]MBV4369029.1 hypothetical protein [Erwinia phyllosphaerae]
MRPATFTLRLTRNVSQFLLPDLRALLPPESVQFFSNELDEEWHYTLLCMQSETSCSLAVSAILIWHQLKRISVMRYSSPSQQLDVSGYASAELYALLRAPDAVLYLS